ncbi:uncharacterized protein C8A04DRAFT_32047 [Dichotomopilus funicola]|uniref:Rhodopsin domain-containing protein n=1 Tax=Dichotomopilus funicola TaxID=1934379 RepID=A0AAN6UWE3_9PEZI|nr:hypothetical protein C8A04DRAFT_32047 [Dichotomopilus funicola]
MASDARPGVDLNESLGPEYAAVIITTCSIAVITLLLRFYTRLFILRTLFPDDYCIIGGMIGTIGMGICYGITIIHGFGHHIEAITPEDLQMQAKASIGGLVFFHWSHAFVKSSILLQNLRLCVTTLEKRICYGALAVIIAEGFVWILLTFVSCTPFQAMWSPHLAKVSCINQTASYYSCAALIILADCFIIAFPAFLLRDSMLPRSQKWAVGAILALGGGACLVSILRMVYIYRSTNSTDSTWDKIPNSILGITEVNMGIILSSLATLRPLIKRIRPSLWAISNVPSTASCTHHNPTLQRRPRPANGDDSVLGRYSNNDGEDGSTTEKGCTCADGGRTDGAAPAELEKTEPEIIPPRSNNIVG